MFTFKEEADVEQNQNPKPTTDSTLLILDRSFDISSALMHDWTYMSFIKEYMEGDVKSQIDDQEKAKLCFNDEDQIW